MTLSALRAALVAAVVICSDGGCAGHPMDTAEPMFGPELGQSTAPGPADPTLRPPPAPGVTEASAHLEGLPAASASPTRTAQATPVEPAQPIQPTAGLIVTIPAPAAASAPAAAVVP
ncbi:MAG TPA: hypothetical protein VF516_25185, partial [Kofleriaceae bacterium]